MEEEPQPGHSGGAEAVTNLQPNSSISIAYHPLFGPHDDLLLLELDEKLLPDILHHKVTVRGEPNEDAVLCTHSTTYALKFVGNSNSVFLIPPSDLSLSNSNDEKNESANAYVLKVAPGNMELVEVAPRLGKLKSLLIENPYRSDEDCMEDMEEVEREKVGLYRWEDLVDRIQASDEELRAELKALSAVEINGYWRIVDEKYLDIVLSMVLHNSVLNGWSLNSLKEDKILGVLETDGFSRRIALHCLEVYGNKLVVEVGEGSCVWGLDERRVCVHFAKFVLKEGKMKMERFLELWMQRIPFGMCAKFEMLEGEVLVEKLGVETWIRAFSVSSLPLTPAERFAALFRERQKWEGKDLQPYIRDLRVPGLSSEGLLLKYTRRTQPTMDVEPIFSAR
ncbi:Sister chromatid cohesion protein Dcc1 [Macleaya cordata]|uniref:Sister chromatid cohesion protein Dcc1 n=1 Tax=Macleaya cordata TaxID=56857 RepID=A0A200PWC0_MACCD|nr:Sister chromatid cohesion protein Dcc1 [Macleaya cordata]